MDGRKSPVLLSVNPQMSQTLSRTRSQVSSDLHDLSQGYAALYTACSPEQLTWRPPEGSWSIAQCVDHVALSVSHYLVPIRKAIAKGGPNAADEDDLFVPGGWFAATFLKRIGPQVTSKFKAPPKLRPRLPNPEQALQELHNGHTEAVRLLRENSHLDLNRIRFRNPFIPVLRFTVAAGFLVLAAHGKRHLLQARRVTESQAFPKSTAG